MVTLLAPTRPSLRRLMIFEATVRLDSAGAAAVEIGLSQPAVTHALSKLEQETKARLLDRGAGGSSATALGQVLHRRTQRMLERIKASFAGLTQVSECGRLDVMTRNLTDAQVRCHVAVVEHGSFRAGAAALGLSEPTLHRAVRGLEAAVDTPLYRRGPHGVMATPAATVFGANLRLALKEIEQGLDELAVAQGVAGGRVSIGCLPLMPKRVLAKAAGELLRQHPNVAISLEEGSRDALSRVLAEGGIDILLGALRRQPSASSLKDQRLFADPYVIVVSARHPLALQASVSWAELAAFPWVAPWRGTPRRDVLEGLFANFPTPPKIVMETSSLPMMSAMLAESACITILSQSQTTRHLEESAPSPIELKVLPLQLDWQDRSIGITTRAEWLPTAIQQSFISIINDINNGGTKSAVQ